MADGPETQTTKPESVLFNGKQPAAEAAPEKPERGGRTGCTSTTELRRHFVENVRTFMGKHVTFSAEDPSFIESWLRVPIRSRNGARPETIRAECIMGAVGSSEMTQTLVQRAWMRQFVQT